jgi:hypothetical protein
MSNFKPKVSKKDQNTKFYENTSGLSRLIQYGQTDTTELRVTPRVVLRTRLQTVRLPKFKKGECSQEKQLLLEKSFKPCELVLCMFRSVYSV